MLTSSSFGFLQTRSGFSASEMLTNAFISSRLCRPNSLYPGVSPSLLVEVAQNAADQLPRASAATPVIPASLHFSFRTDFKILLHGLDFPYMSDLLTLHTPTSSLRSTEQMSAVLRSRLKHRDDWTFRVAAPKSWSQLSSSHQDLRNITHHLKARF